jgi:hypothetical protein
MEKVFDKDEARRGMIPLVMGVGTRMTQLAHCVAAGCRFVEWTTHGMMVSPRELVAEHGFFKWSLVDLNGRASTMRRNYVGRSLPAVDWSKSLPEIMHYLAPSGSVESRMPAPGDLFVAVHVRMFSPRKAMEAVSDEIAEAVLRILRREGVVLLCTDCMAVREMLEGVAGVVVGKGPLPDSDSPEHKSVECVYRAAAEWQAMLGARKIYTFTPESMFTYFHGEVAGIPVETIH